MTLGRQSRPDSPCEETLSASDMGCRKALLILGLTCLLMRSVSTDVPCNNGYARRGDNPPDGDCVDYDECKEEPHLCGNETCINTVGSFYCQCQDGFKTENGLKNFNASSGQSCKDFNECRDIPNICGVRATCKNMMGNYSCTCKAGYRPTDLSSHCTDIDKCKTISSGTCGAEAYCTTTNLSGKGCICLDGYTDRRGDCTDIDECKEDEKANFCGNGTCENLEGSYKCKCPPGYTTYGKEETTCWDIDECTKDEKEKGNICGKGTCKNLKGSYKCNCPSGYTTYGNEKTTCSELSCKANSESAQLPSGLANILSLIRNSCLELSNPDSAEGKANGEVLLEKVFTATAELLSPGGLEGSGDVSGLLGAVEDAMRFIGPQLKHNSTRLETNETEAELAVRRGTTPPTGPIHLTNEHASLDTDWTTATGNGTYPGFALAALVSYKNLEKSMNRSFEQLTQSKDRYRKDGVKPSSFQVFSKVMSAVVSNPSTKHLSSPVSLTLKHLQVEKDTAVRYICAYWQAGSDGQAGGGAWSTDGCDQVSSNDTYTVCSCGHLSSFAVLMARYTIKHPFELVLLSRIGLVISVLCLVLCILTFKFCRSIQGTRTTIHLHLCVCLFLADLLFLIGISQTKPEGLCRFVAGSLHFLFLGVFSWMLLEGVQLYRMVVLVFNATIRPLHLFLFGYGTPLVIVLISSISSPTGYGTDEYCWLSLEDNLIWSFFGPVCLIIIFNIFFFIITVWKLAQKFASLNPDLSKLNKIKAFTVTAIAQMCVLGLMWVFGAFMFEESAGTTAAAYLFTILNSLQGALLFVMHCLLSKQVRDEYAKFLACICAQPKAKYSEFSSTNPSSSRSQGSRSRNAQHTGESQI